MFDKYKAKDDKTIVEHTKDLYDRAEVLYLLNYINENIYRLLRESIHYHDLGKANPEFQQRITNKSKFNEKKEIAHNFLSVFFIDKEQYSEEDYHVIFAAVLFHHNYLKGKELDALGDVSYKELAQELLKEFDTFTIKKVNKLSNKIRESLETDNYILTKGLLNKCDYAASGEYTIEYPNDFLENKLESFAIRNSFQWNELQTYCKEHTNENLVIVAQTGMGKTEAGLNWIGNNKGYFTLPLKTAINAMYLRMKEDILENENAEQTIALVHSDMLSQYTLLQDEVSVKSYSLESKNFSLPLTVSTIDQLFDFVFKYNGFELKLATLSYSKIVIDEIQTYSPDLLAYIIYGLKRISEMGGKFVILTATLPPFITTLLINMGIKFKKSTFIDDEVKRHNLKVIDNYINEQEILDLFREKNGKMLVVCNTVKKSQEIFDFLKTELPNENIQLLHAKFIKKDRLEKETEIMEFGKTEVVANGIWVATQIVEASLDIDFDYLITELSDISSLFQRLGRCNRKGKKDISHYNCFVYLKTNERHLDSGNGKGFIDQIINELSREALKDVDGLLLESEKLNLIDNTLTYEALKGSPFLREYDKNINYIEYIRTHELDIEHVKQEFRNIISYLAIPEIIYLQNCELIEEKLSEINEKKINRMKIINELKNLTLQLGIFDFDQKRDVVDTIKIGYEQVVIVRCEYNFEKGYVKNKREKIEGKFIGNNFL